MSEVITNLIILPLKKTFMGKGEVTGFQFTQILKSPSAFLYEVNTGDEKYYEVFKYKVNKRLNRVSYPTSRGFGIWSWTTSDYNKALEIFNSITNYACRWN